jgi:hypothetical protein
VPVGVTGHRTQRPSGPGAKSDVGPPPDHTQPIPAPLCAQGVNGGQYFRLWPL